MIPTSYHIVLFMNPTNWYWVIEDDELKAVKFGRCASYDEACRAALATHDHLRKVETETML